jgi:hypothetical protein
MGKKDKCRIRSQSLRKYTKLIVKTHGSRAYKVATALPTKAQNNHDVF